LKFPAFAAKESVVAPFARWFVVLVLALGLAVAAQTEQAPSREEIARKVRELGDDGFVVREEATKFLWQAGRAAEAALKEALKSDDAEVVRRARDILEKFKWGIYPDTPKNIVELIERYRAAADPGVKHIAVQDLVKEGKAGYVALQKIAAAEENVETRQTLHQQIAQEAGQVASALLLEGNAAGAEEILEVALWIDNEMARRHYAALVLLRGRLDDRIAHFRALLDREQEIPVAEVLVFLYRARGDLAAARQMADRTSKEPLIQSLMYEQGDWKALAQIPPNKLVKLQPPRGQGEQIEQLGFHAAYQRLAGDQDAFTKSIAELKEQADGRTASDPGLWWIAKAILANERLADALPIVSRYHEPSAAFDLLIAQLRYREAFELADKLLAAKTQDLFLLELKRARALANLGEKDAAQKDFERLVAKLKTNGNTSQLEDLIENLTRAGLTDLAFANAAWVLQRQSGDPRNFNKTLGHLFPKKDATAAVWWRVLAEKYPGEDKAAEAIQQLRAVMTGKMAAKDLEALAREVEGRAAQRDVMEQIAWLQAIGEAFQTAKLDDLAETYFRKAGGVGDGTADALIRLGSHLAGRKLWKRAGDAYHQAWELDPKNPAPLALKGWALIQAGREDEGKKLLELAHWMPLGNDQQRHELADALAKQGLTDEARRQRELILKTGDFDSWYLDDALRHHAYDAVQRKDYLEAARAYERFLQRCQYAYRSFVETPAYLIVPAMIHRCKAKGLLAAGKLDEARQEMQRCIEVLPGDVELPILLVPELEKRGRKQEADDLYRSTAERFEKLCKDFPNSPWAHNSFAWLAVCCKRDLDRAFDHAQKAVTQSPQSAGHLDTLAEVCFQRGDKTAAIQHMKKCIEMEPEKKYFQSQLKRFEAGDMTAALPATED
jgi:Tfp pilus assembly protein PilF